MPDYQSRDFQVRAVNDELREVSGVAVPYGQTVTIAGLFRERFAKGSVGDLTGKPLFWQHAEPIGRIVESRDDEDGHHITARISRTARGDEAYELLKDEVIGRMSISFQPVEDVLDKANNIVTRKKVDTREVSLVSFPAYQGAKVSAVRAEDTTDAAIAAEKEEPVTDTETTPAPVVDAEARASIEDLERRFALQTPQTPAAPAAEYRTSAELLKAIVRGEDAAIEVYNRATEYGDNPEVGEPTVLKDLTRIFDNTTGVLSAAFGTAPLPAKGNTLEFVKLDTNTVDFDKQSAEGADLVGPGKVTSTTDTATVNTYGGYVELTRQTIERSTLPVLQRHLDALAVAAAKRAKAVLRSGFDAAVAAQTTAGATIAAGKAATAMDIFDWTDAIITAALDYEKLGYAADSLVVNATVFRALNRLKDANDRPILARGSDGQNAMGALQLQNLSADIDGMRVILDSGADDTAAEANFINRAAITHYLSPVVSLSDDNIINLTRAYSAYRYGAVATEQAELIIPLVFA